MKSDRSRNQTNKANLYLENVNKIYYAHSMCFYNTLTEQKDLEFLSSKGTTVNPNGLNLGKSMKPYLITVQKCDSVWHRGDTIGVALEVLTALALDKPVYSLENNAETTDSEKSLFIKVFKNFRYREQDRNLILPLFGKNISTKFGRILKGNFK